MIWALHTPFNKIKKFSCGTIIIFFPNRDTLPLQERKLHPLPDLWRFPHVMFNVSFFKRSLKWLLTSIASKKNILQGSPSESYGSHLHDTVYGHCHAEIVTWKSCPTDYARFKTFQRNHPFMPNSFLDKIGGIWNVSIQRNIEIGPMKLQN